MPASWRPGGTAANPRVWFDGAALALLAALRACRHAFPEQFQGGWGPTNPNLACLAFVSPAPRSLGSIASPCCASAALPCLQRQVRAPQLKLSELAGCSSQKHTARSNARCLLLKTRLQPRWPLRCRHPTPAACSRRRPRPLSCTAIRAQHPLPAALLPGSRIRSAGARCRTSAGGR